MLEVKPTKDKELFKRRTFYDILFFVYLRYKNIARSKSYIIYFRGKDNQFFAMCRNDDKRGRIFEDVTREILFLFYLFTRLRKLLSQPSINGNFTCWEKNDRNFNPPEIWYVFISFIYVISD